MAAESTPLIDDIDENTPGNGGNNDQSHEPPASAHFKSFFKVLAVITLVLSLLTVTLLITNYIIVRAAPLGNSGRWNARRESAALGKVLVASLVFAVINVIANFPILLNIIVDIVLTAFIIPDVVHLIDAFADSNWCWSYGRPIPPPDLKCHHWKLVVRVLMGVTAGFSLLLCVIYLVQLALRSIAFYRTKFWKKAFTYTLPPGEITFQVRLRVLKNQESGGQSVEARAGPEHGPVYI